MSAMSSPPDRLRLTCLSALQKDFDFASHTRYLPCGYGIECKYGVTCTRAHSVPPGSSLLHPELPPPIILVPHPPPSRSPRPSEAEIAYWNVMQPLSITRGRRATEDRRIVLGSFIDGLFKMLPYHVSPIRQLTAVESTAHTKRMA